jgi:hypothetical protein
MIVFMENAEHRPHFGPYSVPDENIHRQHDIEDAVKAAYPYVHAAEYGAELAIFGNWYDFLGNMQNVEIGRLYRLDRESAENMISRGAIHVTKGGVMEVGPRRHVYGR